jgi:hypothetical protein
VLLARGNGGGHFKARPNNRIELTALRAAAHTERWAVYNHFLLDSQISVGSPTENRRLSKALDWGF